MVPLFVIFIRSNALVLNDKSPALADKPEVVLPVKIREGANVVPAGSCNVPVIVSPALRTLAEAAPVKLAVIVPAEKLPDPSRATIVSVVFALVASVPMVISFALLVIAICVSVSNDLKFNVVPVLFLNTRPVPVPTLAPVVVSGKLKSTNSIGSVSITANGVLQSHADPV